MHMSKLSQFELPRAYTKPSDQEYVPPATHDELIAVQRRQYPARTLVLGEQYRGALTANFWVERLLENGKQEDLVFSAKVLAAALFGSARLSLEGGQSVMRRHINLPIIADVETEERISEEAIMDMTLGGMEATAEFAENIYRANRALGRVSLRRSHLFGRLAGESALWTALLPYHAIGMTGTAEQVQQAVRQVGLNALDTTQELYDEIGMYPTLAMLGGPVTNLSSYVERNAPHGAYNSLRTAQKQARNIADIH